MPGEERFIGRGVAWCATCDAPLYRDKRVAVVGGGNSAFTAVRDLLRYAAEIHVIHMLDGFQADPVLVRVSVRHQNRPSDLYPLAGRSVSGACNEQR